MIDNVENFVAFVVSFGKEPHFFHVSIQATIKLHLAGIFNHFFKNPIDFNYIAYISTLLQLILCIFVFFYTKSLYTKFMVVGIINAYVFNSIPYNMVYYIIPYIILIGQNNENISDNVIFFLLSLLLIPIFNICDSQIVKIRLYNLLSFLLIVCVFYKIIKEFKLKKV